MATVSSQQTVEAEYDGMVEMYKEMTANELESHGYKDKLRWLATASDGGPILDVGCGHGYMLQFLAAECGVSSDRLGGHDLSAGMLKEAAAAVPGAKFTQGTCTALTEAGWTAQGSVLCMFVLQHLPRSEMKDAVACLAHVLRPGGALLLGVWLGDGTQAWGPAMTGSLYSREEVSAALQAAGFGKVEFEEEKFVDEEFDGEPDLMLFVKAVKEL
jgi:ubiquinone/menaquinone biosynthesis C-methylase UbiE